MSSVVYMPQVGNPPELGRVVRVYRLRGQSIDVDEPLVDVQVGHHILTIRTHRDGQLYDNLQVGQTLKAGQKVAEISGVGPHRTDQIFVAYRRADSTGHAGRVGELLMTRFGEMAGIQGHRRLAARPRLR